MDILVDTSVWVDFFNKTENPQVLYLEKLLQTGRVAICPVILMEILQGIRSDGTCKKTERYLSILTTYPITDPLFIESAIQPFSHSAIQPCCTDTPEKRGSPFARVLIVLLL